MRRVFFLLALALMQASCGSDPTVVTQTPATVSITAEPPPTVQSGVAIAPAPVVALLDRNGARVAARGVLISASLASGTGTVAGTVDVRTDAQGSAVFADLKIVGEPGPKSLRFAATGLTSATSTVVSLVAGLPAAMTPSAGNNQTTAAGTAVATAPAVLVVDAAGNPVADVPITFAVTSGAGSVTGGSTVSGPNGVAAVTQWTLGPTVGANALTAAAGSLQVVFSATGIVGPAAKIVLVEGDGQSATIGNAVPVAPAVKLADAFDNPVGGVAVTFTPGVDGVVVGGSPLTDAAGVARVGSWSIGLTPGAHTIVASRTGAPSVTITATGTDFSITRLAAGAFTNCGLTAAGATYCFGDNIEGTLGNGSPDTVSNVPVRVTTSSTVQFTSIAMGGAHACGLTSAGAAYCWGNNSSGQLGDSTLTNSNLPVVVRGGHVFQSISLGDSHTCALKANGAAWCWGSNSNGRLGDSTTVGRRTPVAVKTIQTFTSLSAGSGHNCARTLAGSLYCWGANGSGRLGDGTTTDQRQPVLVVSPGTVFASVAAGGGFTCALTSTGTAMCWGSGASGALGDGTVTGHVAPAAVSGTTTFTSLAVGTLHACAVTSAGQVYCWGSNGSGRLGDGTATNRLVPTAVIGPLKAASLELGFEHSCAISQAGSAICWGRNAEGQLGDGGLISMPKPVGVKKP